ncbi:MAG: Holliday junction branch migration protein RuvA [Anaerolineaceae bacterium 4572_78]|nr:MAG: Holliday junction branch migration protein RuvA [Anaerolineaceae bacterium 4572_78]
MIGSIRGEVTEKGENYILIDVNGVGYVVYVPAYILDETEVGKQAFVRTHLHVRENELTLYGFKDKESIDIYHELLKVQGIGPKVAMAIHSTLSNEAIKQAVTRNEAAILAKVPGIGLKKARKIVFELKGKVTYDDISAPDMPDFQDDDGEVIAALTSLGYSVVEAQVALQNLPKKSKDESVEEKIRLALSSMAKI